MTPHKYILSFFTLILSVLYSNGQTQVIGKVVDNETKRPINGAKILIDQNGAEVITNIMGYFQIAADSSSRIIISHPEYEPVFISTKGSRIQISLTKLKNLPDSIKNTVFTNVDKEAYCKIGDSGMIKLIRENLKMPENMRNHGQSGKVLARLLISEKGRIDSITFIESDHELFSLEAYRVITLLGEFEPAQKYGIPVKSWVSLPVNFKVEGITVRNKISDKALALDFYNIAIRYLKTNLNREALPILTRAIELDNKMTDAWYNRAALYYVLGRQTEACSDWSMAMQLGDKQSKELIKLYCK